MPTSRTPPWEAALSMSRCSRHTVARLQGPSTSGSGAHVNGTVGASRAVMLSEVLTIPASRKSGRMRLRLVSAARATPEDGGRSSRHGQQRSAGRACVRAQWLACLSCVLASSDVQLKRGCARSLEHASMLTTIEAGDTLFNISSGGIMTAPNPSQTLACQERDLLIGEPVANLKLQGALHCRRRCPRHPRRPSCP